MQAAKQQRQGSTTHATNHCRSRAARRNTTRTSVRATRPPKQNRKESNTSAECGGGSTTGLLNNRYL